MRYLAFAVASPRDALPALRAALPPPCAGTWLAVAPPRDALPALRAAVEALARRGGGAALARVAVLLADGGQRLGAKHLARLA